MFEAERRMTIAASPDRVRTVLADVEHLERLLPQADHVEVRGITPDRARVTIGLRMGKLGVQRFDGEARILSNGVRFVAVQPTQVDARWTVEPQGQGSNVVAHLQIEPGGVLRSFSRFLPRRPIEDKLGQELDTSLYALQQIVAPTSME